METAAEEDSNLPTPLLRRDYEELAKHRPSQNQIIKLLKQPEFFRLPRGATSRNQSKRLDKILGFKISKVEQKLLKKYKAYYSLDQSGRKQKYQGCETWIGLHPQVLQTPYNEIFDFFEVLKMHNPKSIVDIGAGYGRVGLVMASMFPEATFSGYEIVEKRLEEGNRIFERLELDQCQMYYADLSKESFTPPIADIYFIYDFSDPLDIRKILGQLRAVNENRKAFVIAKGEFIQPILTKYPEFKSIVPLAKGKSWDILQLN